MFRLVTYNVRHCLGMDGEVSPSRIAEVIASCNPNIVALQELDVARERTGGIDQAHAIAVELRMHMHFHPAMSVNVEKYGDAILTDRPAALVKAGALPSPSGRRVLEPRGALWVSTQIGGARLDVINTHLGLRGHERLMQVDHLLGPEWVGGSRHPLLFVGDFNAVPRSRAYRRIATRLRDVQSCLQAPACATFPSALPFLRLDHVFASADVEVLRFQTIRTQLARIASDHLPLLLEFRLGGKISAAHHHQHHVAP